MTRSTPRISIGLPVYNGERHLAETIECLLGQDFEDFELIISDNASNDGTEEICRQSAARDRRIRYHRSETNSGAAGNYNRTFELSTAEYFKWAAHDDLCAPTYLRRCLETVEQDPSRVVLCYGQTTLVDDQGEVLRPYEDNLDIRHDRPADRLRHLLQNLILCNALEGLIRSDALRATRLIGSYPAADVVLLAELVLQGRFHEIPEPLFFRRVQSDEAGGGNEKPKHMQANTTTRQVATWFDPRNREYLSIPRTRRLFEHLRAIRRSSLSRRDKAACYRVLLRERLVGNRQWRVLGGEVKRALAARLAERRQRRVSTSGTGTT